MKALFVLAILAVGIVFNGCGGVGDADLRALQSYEIEVISEKLVGGSWLPIAAEPDGSLSIMKGNKVRFSINWTKDGQPSVAPRYEITSHVDFYEGTNVSQNFARISALEVQAAGLGQTTVRLTSAIVSAPYRSWTKEIIFQIR